MFGTPLTVPGKFLDSPELPPSTYLSKIERAVASFAVPPPRHVLQSPPCHVLQSLPCQLSSALMFAKNMFAKEVASIPSLASLYRGPYLILEQGTTFFCLQLVQNRCYLCGQA